MRDRIVIECRPMEPDDRVAYSAWSKVWLRARGAFRRGIHALAYKSVTPEERAKREAWRRDVQSRSDRAAFDRR